MSRFEIFCSFLHCKMKQTPLCLFWGVSHFTFLSFFQQKRTFPLSGFSIALVQRCVSMCLLFKNAFPCGKRDLLLTRKHYTCLGISLSTGVFSVLWNIWKKIFAKIVNGYRKKLHLKCLAEFQIRLRISNQDFKWQNKIFFFTSIKWSSLALDSLIYIHVYIHM